MKIIFTVLAMCLCLPVVGADKKKPLPKDFNSLKALAEKGDRVAQYALGQKFWNMVKDEKEEAAKWFRKAAEQGEAFAQSFLGEMYSEGQGVEQDFKEAIKWHQKAAEQGDAGGQFRLGFMYYNGKGVLEDDVTAYAWLNIAQANGSKNAKEGKDLIAKAKKMSPEQFAKAEELSKEMIKKNPKLIKE